MRAEDRHVGQGHAAGLVGLQEVDRGCVLTALLLGLVVIALVGALDGMLLVRAMLGARKANQAAAHIRFG